MMAPDKIYIHEASAPELTDKLPYHIEYIRKDAFMKKVFDAYCKVCGHYHHTVPTHICRQDCDYFKDFRKYMEDKL